MAEPVPGTTIARSDGPVGVCMKTKAIFLSLRMKAVIATSVLSLAAVVAPHGIWLLDTALSDAFPHILLRDYAAEACRALVAGGQMTLSDSRRQGRRD